LCLKYGLANPFPGLLRTSLGQYTPQQRVESAIGRGERNAVIACLELLSDACHGLAPPARPDARAPEMPEPKSAALRFTHGRVILFVALGALAAIAVGLNWHSGSVRLPVARNMEEQPFGKRSGDDLGASWEAGRKKKSARFTDAELQRMVDRLFVQDDPGRTNFHGLLYADARPLPYLLKALDDPRTSTIVFAPKGFDPIEMFPFGRICGLLDEFAPVEAAKPLARYLDHPDPMFRRKAASLLASLGCAECLEPVKKALTDEDHQVREATLGGLNRGLAQRQPDVGFLSGVFPVLVPLLAAGTYSTVSPAEVMMAVDPIKAAPILESPRYFAVRNPQLREVLTALDRENVKISREIVLPLLAKLEPLAGNPREESIYAAALVLYANNPDDRAESRFWSLIDSPSSTIASTAALGLKILAGINPHAAVWNVYDKRGFAAMTEPQQFYFAVEIYKDEVDNGGHNQYFYNDESDLYRKAIEGLRAIGAPVHSAMLLDAARAFAPGQPAPTEGERRNQMEGFGPVQSAIFASADQRFYDSEKEPSSRLDVLLARYALKHRSDFANPPSSDPRRGSHNIDAKKP
jgi:HEAT repeat protein